MRVKNFALMVGCIQQLAELRVKCRENNTASQSANKNSKQQSGCIMPAHYIIGTQWVHMCGNLRCFRELQVFHVG